MLNLTYLLASAGGSLLPPKLSALVHPTYTRRVVQLGSNPLRSLADSTEYGSMSVRDGRLELHHRQGVPLELILV